MAEPADGRGALETLTLVGVGALALAAGRVDEIADDLAARLGTDRDEMRAALGDALAAWRREASRVGRSTSGAASRLAEELGLARRDVVEDLELRVAQLEHRVKLLERG
jgi:polyhydroxyalkanoate synthesis regulator phasin